MGLASLYLGYKYSYGLSVATLDLQVPVCDSSEHAAQVGVLRNLEEANALVPFASHCLAAPLQSLWHQGHGWIAVQGRVYTSDQNHCSCDSPYSHVVGHHAVCRVEIAWVAMSWCNNKGMEHAKSHLL